MKTDRHPTSLTTSINPSLKGKQSEASIVNISRLLGERGEASVQEDDPFLLGWKLPYIHMSFFSRR